MCMIAILSSVMVFKDNQVFLKLVHETANSLITTASHKTLHSLDNHGPVTGKQELQMEELQEQLMMAVMEKQQIADELKNLKEEQMKALVQQLRLEREKNRQLAEEITQKPKRKYAVRRKNDNLFKSKSMTSLNHVDGNAGVELETMEEEDEDDDEGFQKQTDESSGNSDVTVLTNSTEEVTVPNNTTQPWIKITQDWFGNCMESVRHDFSEITDTNENHEDPFGEPLNITKLKRNLIRSGNALDPLTDVGNDLHSIFRWEKPSLTFCVFMVYMYCIYQGLFITFTLSILTFLFVYAYIRQKEWNDNSELAGKIDAKELEMNISVRDQIAITLQVSRRAQNLSGQLCDVAEKIKNLVLWKQPELTKQAMVGLVAGLIGSFIFSASTLCSLAGYYMGIRLFVIEYVFFRFPRVKQKYDIVSKIYSQLMSDVQLQKKLRQQSASNKSKRSSKSGNLGSSQPISISTPNLNRSVSEVNISSNEATISSSTFNETFNIPATETPLPLWHDGRKCTFVNKDKPLTGTFRVGKMYLTNNYLCFERFKYPSHKNLAIPLDTISKIDKTKLVTWLPGGGRALEVRAKGFNKRLIFVFQTQLFGTIANRDEAYESIMDAGRRNGHRWAN